MNAGLDRRPAQEVVEDDRGQVVVTDSEKRGSEEPDIVRTAVVWTFEQIIEVEPRSGC